MSKKNLNKIREKNFNSIEILIDDINSQEYNGKNGILRVNSGCCRPNPHCNDPSCKSCKH